MDKETTTPQESAQTPISDEMIREALKSFIRTEVESILREHKLIP